MERRDRSKLASRDYNIYLKELNNPKFVHNPKIVRGVITAALGLKEQFGNGTGSVIYPSWISKQDSRAARMRLTEEHKIGHRVVIVNGIPIESGQGAKIILLKEKKIKI